jgi:hypothetical protein
LLHFANRLKIIRMMTKFSEKNASQYASFSKYQHRYDGIVFRGIS